MSLRSKIILVLSLVVSIFVVVDNVMQRIVIFDGFVEVEQASAETDLKRVSQAVEHELATLTKNARGWANWNETINFARGESQLFAEEDLGTRLFDSLGVDLLFLCDATGKVLWSRILDPASGASLHLKDFPTGSLSPAHRLFPKDVEQPVVQGILPTEKGPLLACSQPIGSNSSEPLGTLIAARFMDGEWAAARSEQLQVPFVAWQLDRHELGDDSSELLDAITGSGDPVTRPGEDGVLHGYASLSGIDLAPAVILRTQTDRTITARGTRSVNYALLSTLGTALLILIVLLRLLQNIVIQPLSKLTSLATAIGRTDDTSQRTGIDREDEVGQLSHEFDSMLEKLAESRQEVVRTARLAGMSEIATDVLHNVGNVLNSVTVSTGLLMKRTQSLPTQDLERMSSVLDQNADDLGHFVTEHAQGKHLLPFLKELSQTFQQRQQDIAGEIANLSQGVEHIAELVRSQQAYAGRGGVEDYGQPSELLNSAVSICRRPGDEATIEFIRSFEELPDVALDRQKVLEILVNLIKNAIDALDELSTGEKQIHLHIRHGEPDKLELIVEDNGAGIDPTELTRIFEHGFSTKSHGHGFGLHASANAAVEMRGRLYAESAGRGAGTKFVLELPFRTRPLVEAA